jgi:class 3 adenylate cyclase
MAGPKAGPRGTLFRKYFLVLFVAVLVPLLASGASDAWFGYRDRRAMLSAFLQAEASAAASKIQGFVDGITDQLAWAVQQPWTPETEEQHRLDALRVLNQTPAVASITLVDAAGAERLHVSRLDLNRTNSGIDRSRDPAVSGARSAGVWFGPVAFLHESEPFMTIARGGNRRAVGIVIAEVNLKSIWELISAIQIGESGHALVLDQPGRLIAHPDINQVLRGAADQSAAGLRRLRDAIVAAGGEAIAAGGERPGVLAAMAQIPGVNWTVLVEQDSSEAFAPINAALWRTAGLLLAAAVFAAALAYFLAQRMTRPIRRLEEGAERIGAGQLDYRIDIASGDELEHLATRFNDMARELAVSQERSERIGRLKRFLAPQVAELIERGGAETMLAGQRAEVVVAFCDLRGFTALSARAEPEELMALLRDYHQALGSVITGFEATLTSFSGDGLMVLVNAPLPREEPALHAANMAVEMQDAVQGLLSAWRPRGHAIGFGVGLAMGWATVGRIGYEHRAEYTAIGNVVNLAARLCAAAEDGQILVDAALAEALGGQLRVNALGLRDIKGYAEQVPVYAIERKAPSA